MAFRVPNLSEFETILVAFFKALFGGSNVGARTSYHRRKMQVVAAAGTQLHAHVDSVRDDVMPDTARGVMAERWGALHGVTKKGATPARRSDALRVVGDAGSPIAAGTTLTHPASGLRFMIGEDEVMPAGEEVDVDIVAIDTGSRTRLTKGEVLEFDATPAGIQTRAELQLDMNVDGDDIEQEGAFKRRYLDVMGQPTAGGNQTDYQSWLVAIEGIAQAYCYPNRAGLGTVDVVALHNGSGEDRILTAGEAEDAIDVLRSKGPSTVTGDGGSIRHLTVIADEQPIEVTIEPIGDAEWDFDWSDEDPPTVDSWDPDTRILTFAADRPSTMKAGDRLVIHGVASDQTGEPLKVEALVSTDGVKLQVAPTVAPEPTDVVYAGGPLTAMVRDALLAHISGQLVYAGDDGPIPAGVAEEANATIFELRVLATGLGPANPAGKYGPWSGALVQTVLERIASYSRGVRNATCVLPAADYEATDNAFPNDASIGMITPGEVLVRRAW